MNPLNLKPGTKVFVCAHGKIKEDFTGKVVRVDQNNYLIFVKKAKSKIVWGCFASFVH